MATRFDRGFRFPLQKYSDEKALYSNFRYIQEYLNYIRKKDIYGTTIIIASSTSDEPQRAHYQCDGENDQEQIQAAFDDLSTTGGEIVLLEGQYNMPADAQPTHGAGVHIRVSGKGAIINLTSVGQFFVNGGGTTWFDSIAFTGTPFNCIISDAVTPPHVIVTNCYFYDLTCGTSVLGTVGIPSTGSWIVEGNYFYNVNVGAFLIGADGGSRVGTFLVVGNRFDDCTGTAFSNTHGFLYAAGNLLQQHTGSMVAGGTVIHSHNVFNGAMVSGSHGDIDHGALAGLADDDHTQYVTRSILTTRGDIFTRSASAIQRLALGADGFVLTSDGTDAVWEAPAAIAHEILSVTHSDVDETDTPIDGDILTWYEPTVSGPPTVRAVGTAASGLPPSPGLPAGTVNGDLLFLITESQPGGTAVSVADWTAAPGSPQNGTHALLNVFYKVADGSDSPAITGGSEHMISQILGITEGTYEPTAIINASGFNVNGTGATTVTINGITTTAGEMLVLSFAAINEDGAASAPTNASLTELTEQLDSVTLDGNDGGIVVISGRKAVAGSVSATTFPYSLNVAWGAIMLAITPLGGGPDAAGRWIANPQPASASHTHLLATEYYSADATWTKADYPGITHVFVQLVGSGGAGGGPPATTGSQFAGGNGGAAGGYSEKTILAAALGATETLTVPAGGAGNAGAAGDAGATCSFGAHCSAAGGAGGAILTAGLAASTAVIAGSPGGTGSGGDLNAYGGTSGFFVRMEGGSVCVPSPGGNSFFAAGRSWASSGNGVAAQYGAGGGGARNSGNPSAAKTGGAGGDALIRVEVYGNGS